MFFLATGSAFAQPAVPTITIGGSNSSPVICSGESRTLTASSIAANSGNMLTFPSEDNLHDTNGVALPLVDFTGFQGFTFEAWIKPTASSLATVHWARVFSVQGTDQFSLLMQNGDAQKIGTQGFVGIASDIVYQQNTWMHIALTIDSLFGKLYIDGVLVKTQPTPRNGAGYWNWGKKIGQTRRFFLGKPSPNEFGVSGSARPFCGSMDEVRIWSVVRTQQEIVDNFHRAIDQGAAGLFMYYKMDETDGKVVHDASGNNYHGTLYKFSNPPVQMNPWQTSEVTPFNTNSVFYHWSGPAGTLSDTLGATVTVSPSTVGTSTYTVIATDLQGNTSTGNQIITVTSEAAPTITPANYRACETAVNLTASGTGPWMWSTGETTQSILATQTGNYFVSSGSCYSRTAQISLRANDLSSPVVGFTTGSASLCIGQSAVLNVTAANPGGTSGSALRFKSSTAGGNYVELPSDINTRMTNAVTWEGWVKLSAVDAGYVPLFSFGSSVHGRSAFDSGSYIMMRVETGGQLSFKGLRRSNNNGYNQDNILPTGTRFTANSWTHIALVLDGTRMYVYFNGTLAYSTGKSVLPYMLGTNTGVDNWNLLGHSLYANSVGTEPVFKGWMDEVRIWNTARNATQISDNYRKSIEASAPGLLVYYQFDEDTTFTGAAVTSSTGSNNANLSSNYLLYTAQPYTGSTLSPYSSIRYFWSSPTNPDLGSGPSITVNPTETTTYTVTARSVAGCDAASTQLITVFPDIVVINQPGEGTSCNNGNVTFTVNATGVSSYKWQKSTDAGATWTDVIASTLYSGETTSSLLLTAPTDTLLGTIYRASMIAGCGTEQFTVSAPVSFASSGPPAISLSSLYGDTICPGTAVFFTAVPQNTGTDPVFVWSVNGIPITGNSGASYRTDSLRNGDVVTITMTSNAPCATIPTVSASSGRFYVPASGQLPGSVTLSNSSGNSHPCPGTITFTANGVNGGPAAFYQWKVNGQSVGTGERTYTADFAEGDSVEVYMESSFACVTPSLSRSKSAKICKYHDYLWDNFKDARNVGYFNVSGNISTGSNPGPSVVNMAPVVGIYTRSAIPVDEIVFNWNRYLADIDKYLSGENKFSMKIFSPVANTKLTLILLDTAIATAGNYPTGRYAEFGATATGAANSWQQVIFDLNSRPDNAIGIDNVTHASLMINPNQPGQIAGNYYLDEIYGPHFSLVNGIRSKQLSSSDLLLNPNPATDIINLHFPNKGDREVTVQLCDINGRTVISQNIQGSSNGMVNTTLQTDLLAPGLYTCRVITSNGITVKKVVINR
ncbi:MAG: LamG-like jellyroll fold domain-containing protein [Bacteroidota bacterium]